MKTLDQMVKEIQNLTGEGKFIQFAFYLSPGEHTGLAKPWVKIETAPSEDEYIVAQSTGQDTLEEAFDHCLIKLEAKLK